jgi:hypothetical protein
VVEARTPEYDVKSLVDRRRTRLCGLVFVASESLRQLRDALLLLFDDGAEALDGLPRILGGDAAPVTVVAAPAGGGGFAGSQHRCGACELGARWWTVVA